MNVYSLIPTLDLVVIWLNFSPHNFQLSGLIYLLAGRFLRPKWTDNRYWTVNQYTSPI